MTPPGHPPTGRRYVLISPCRDEEAYLQTTIDAVAAQTVPPARWIVVDDGSTDRTPEILARAAESLPCLEVVRREDRGERRVGPGVIEAFYDGLSHVSLDDCDYVAKFDVDLDFGPRYFERSMEMFEADPLMGTLSGKLHLRHNGGLVEERCGDENSVGPVKFYRVECFRDIGGFVREVCWDGIDGHMCRMHGWIAASVRDPDLTITHLRQMGSSHRSLWHGRQRWGWGKYYMGTSLDYALAVSVYRMLERPYVIGGLGILTGYLRAMLQRRPHFDNPEFRRELRRYERRSLLTGKSRTARHYNDRIRAAHNGPTTAAEPIAQESPV